MSKEVTYTNRLWDSVPVGTRSTTFTLNREGNVKCHTIATYDSGVIETKTSPSFYRGVADIRESIHGVDVLFWEKKAYYHENLDGTGPSGYSGYGN